MADIEFTGFAGVRLAAEELGAPDDPTVLLLHDGFETRRAWARTAAALVAVGRRVINLDLRGHGESERPADARYDLTAFAEDVRAVLRALGSRPVIVAGTLGGWAAVAALRDESANLAAGLVLVDAPPELQSPAREKVKARLERAAARRPDSVPWDTRLLNAIDSDKALQLMNTLAPKITIPALIVRGAASDLARREAFEAFVSALPQGEFAEVATSGPFVGTDPTDEFNALLVDFLERKAPRAPIEYHAGSDARTLRDALGCFATGVTIITALDAGGEPVGLTANSFTSVSLDPALVLVCVANTSASLPILLAARHFAVNILHIGQQPASHRFTRRDEDRFGATSWEPGMRGLPLLTNSLANFECERFAVHEGGDHAIIIGRVVHARFDRSRDPLLYFGGRYRRLHLS
ncbi:MAG: alpha/beta fold hydrolase [Caulobacteraceae bacterium]|nr:alpha/beta fold hydrolase [Caulobacteraceae bacterium]